MAAFTCNICGKGFDLDDCSCDAKPEAPSDKVLKLATAFSHVLHEWIGDRMAEVVKLNGAETMEGVCHSHDFCDANMAMDAAFERAFGYSPLDDEQRDEADGGMSVANMELWNAAWDLAKDKGFALKA
jgi:hypothetical protein